MLAPPPGDAYNFLLKYVNPPSMLESSGHYTHTTASLISYPLAIVNIFVSYGLIHIYFHRSAYPDFLPKIRATLPVTIFFFLSNVYLAIAPYVPPSDGESVYESLPYYLHCVVALGIFAVGGIYWVIWARILPRIGGYKLQVKTIIEDDGWSRSLFVKVPREENQDNSIVVG